MDANKRKHQLLGMPFGTASGKLRKALLYKLAGMSNMLNCFQCGAAIESLEEFSIEHKVAWGSSPTPKETFFDLNNIAFSHATCNSRAATRPKKYMDAAERGREQFKRYYGRHKDKFLSNKRDRYRAGKKTIAG